METNNLTIELTEAQREALSRAAGKDGWLEDVQGWATELLTFVAGEGNDARRNAVRLLLRDRRPVASKD